MGSYEKFVTDVGLAVDKEVPITYWKSWAPDPPWRLTTTTLIKPCVSRIAERRRNHFSRFQLLCKGWNRALRSDWMRARSSITGRTRTAASPTTQRAMFTVKGMPVKHRIDNGFLSSL